MKSKSPTRPSVRRAASVRSRARGFTLIEVMVALVITAIGLLGIAKIQALAYASTGSAGLRSLVALQASSLAATMHANRNFWSAGLAAPLTITGTTVNDATLGIPIDCTVGSAAVPCDKTQVAAYDLQKYALALNTLVRNSPLTTITCPVATPVSCTILVQWYEHTVSIDQQSVAGTVQSTTTTAATTVGAFAPAYTLFVEP